MMTSVNQYKYMKQNKNRSLVKRSQAPKGLKFGLSHHRHSGRLLAHHHTSYPVLAMILLLVGVLLNSTSHVAKAATISDSGSYQVTAAYLGPPPSSAATIDAPIDGARITATPIRVSGSCPSDTYVTLTRNGVTSGSVLCSLANTYSLQTDLFSGANAMQAHVFSKFNVAGPASNSVTVTYNAPAAVSNGSTAPSSASSSASSAASAGSGVGEPLLLKSNFQYIGHNLGQPVAYQYEIIGGTAPYAVTINWGDGTTKTLSLAASGPFSVNHTYEKTSQHQSSYTIVANASDVQGHQTIVQLLAIVNDRPTVPLASAIGSNSGDNLFQQLRNILKYIWPTYGIAVLMIAAFWFGELRELKLLHVKPGRSHHA